MRSELKLFMLIVVVFLVFYFVPFDAPIVSDSIVNGFKMLNEYTRKHVLLCLVPAFFIAGTISVMLKKDAVLKLLGPNAKRCISYPIAAVSGAFLAVCSCTILPLFGGIYKKGAGIGPATTFRFVESTSDGADSVKAVVFFLIQLLFIAVSGLKINTRMKYSSLGVLGLSTLMIAVFAFEKRQTKNWLYETWDFAKKILPYLFIGVFLAGVITRLLPQDVVVYLLGKNDFFSAFTASIIGTLMYFATLTEVPIVQALTESGMAKGPTLALLMAGNSLSLPSMLVITRLLGKKRASTYFGLVVLFSTLFGMIYGNVV